MIERNLAELEATNLLDGGYGHGSVVSINGRIRITEHRLIFKSGKQSIRFLIR